MTGSKNQRTNGFFSERYIFFHKQPVIHITQIGGIFSAGQNLRHRALIAGAKHIGRICIKIDTHNQNYERKKAQRPF